MIVKRVAGCNVVVNPIPPDRLRKIGMIIAAAGMFYAMADGGDGKFDGVVHMCRLLADTIGFHVSTMRF